MRRPTSFSVFVFGVLFDLIRAGKSMGTIADPML